MVLLRSGVAATRAMEAAEREARLRASPVCPGQLFDSSKFGEICGNQCQLVSDGLPGNQKVISANRLSDGLQISSDRASDFSILILKGQRMNRAGKKSLESLLVKISPRTFRDAVPEFEQSDGGHKYLAAEVSRLPKPGTDRGRMPIDQRDAGIRIQQIVHLKILRRGVMG